MNENKCDAIDIWEILGRRWSLHILKNLSTNGSTRFNELKRLLTGISSTVLSDRLLELKREGLISKKIYAEIPVRVEYRLTLRAKELEPILYQLSNWINRWNSNEKKNKIETTTTT
jgi:DNA-binding HxlR family transcriptional regulator